MSHRQVLCRTAQWVSRSLHAHTTSRKDLPLTTPTGAPTAADDALTVDQLAARVGMTVRNVRAYAARGLLPPPRLVGRTGYYGRHHVARLQLVREMLAEGWSLGVIERTLSRAPATASTTTLALHRALVEPWLPPEPEETTAAELAEVAGLPADPGLVDQLVDFGLVERLDGDRIRVLDPALLTAGLNVVELGVPPLALLAAQRVVRDRVREIAATYVEMFVDTMADDLLEQSALPEIGGTMAQLQSAAAQALLASFRTEMARAVEEAVRERLAAEEQAAADREDGDEEDHGRSGAA